jgi:hypothetical protein
MPRSALLGYGQRVDGPTTTAVFGLVGVLIGGGITTGFEVWKRIDDRKESRLDRLVDAAMDVQETGTAAFYQADLFTLVLRDVGSYEEVLTHPQFKANADAASRYLTAIARARMVARGGLRVKLITAQDKLNDELAAARAVGVAAGKPAEHGQRLSQYVLELMAARAANNDFLVAVVDYLEKQRA